jgi:hypothetical protein
MLRSHLPLSLVSPACKFLWAGIYSLRIIPLLPPATAMESAVGSLSAKDHSTLHQYHASFEKPGGAGGSTPPRLLVRSRVDGGCAL